ncbi:MAG TPA: hypothetical protein VFJ12_10565 [Segeticoccus sp.]|nr:hypothetical protein [Segeticoccus sp.]
MRELPEELSRLATDQLGLLTRRQLRRGGVTDAVMRRAFGREWQLVLPRVVALFTGELTPDQRLTAGSLYAGPGALLTGPTAAELYGVTSDWVSAYPLHRFVVRPSQTDRSSGFVVVRRSERSERHPRPLHGIRVVSAARAVGDAARVCRSPRDARQLAISALQSRVVSEQQIYDEAIRGQVQHGQALRQGVRDFAAGAWSIAEVDLQQLLASSPVLPSAMYNPMLSTEGGAVLPTPDAWLDDVAAAIQLHSREYHGTEEDWNHTVMQDGRLTEHGIVVIPVTPSRVRDDPAAVLRHVETTYLGLLDGRRRPTVVATERHHLDVLPEGR